MPWTRRSISVTLGMTRSVILVSTQAVQSISGGGALWTASSRSTLISRAEGTSLAALLDVLGRPSDTTEIYICEAKAHRMLHAHLDQQAPTRC
jgi:hypothetical protein